MTINVVTGRRAGFITPAVTVQTVSGYLVWIRKINECTQNTFHDLIVARCKFNLHKNPPNKLRSHITLPPPAPHLHL